MSDTQTQNNKAPEAPKQTNAPEATKLVADRAAAISRLIHTQLQRNFPDAHEAERRLPTLERDDLAFKLARREADMREAARIRTELQVKSPDDTVALAAAKDKYHLARESYQSHSEVVARRLGMNTTEMRFLDGLDATKRQVKRAASYARHHAVPITALGGVGAYTAANLVGGTGLKAIGTTLFNAVGGSSALSFFVNGGLVTLGGGAGYVAGKYVGRGIDYVAKRFTRKPIGAERIGKYVGMLGGGLGTAFGLGLSAASVATTAGVPLVAYTGWKVGMGVYRWIKQPRQFDLQTAERAAERAEAGPHMVRSMDLLRRTYLDVGGSAGSTIMTRLATVRAMADALATNTTPYSLAEIQAEWDKLRPELEEAIKSAQKRASERSPDIRAAQAFGAQIKALRDRWARQAATPPAIPADLEATLTGVTDMVTDFASNTPRHTLKSIEDAYKLAEDQFNKAWDKQAERRDTLRKINLLTGQCTELRDRWNNSLPVSGTRPSLPVDVDGALRNVETMARDLTGSTTSAFTPKQVEDAFAEAKERFGKAWDKALERNENIRKAGVYGARIEEFRQRWDDVRPVVALPADLNGALTQATNVITDFTTGTPARFSMADVEAAFTYADGKFKAAWEKLMMRTDEDLPEYKKMGASMFKDLHDVFATFDPANANHPAVQQAYAAARAADTAAALANTRLQSARTVDEGRKHLETLATQEDVIALKIPEARALLQRAHRAAEQAILEVRALPTEAVAIVRDLPRRFQNLRRYTDLQQQQADAAKIRGASGSEMEEIWNRNRGDIGNARTELVADLDRLLGVPGWPQDDIVGLRTDVTTAIDAAPNPGFRPVALKAVFDSVEPRLNRNVQQGVAPLLGDLGVLRTVAGEGAPTIDRLMTQYGSVATMPDSATTERILRQFRDQTVTP